MILQLPMRQLTYYTIYRIAHRYESVTNPNIVGTTFLHASEPGHLFVCHLVKNANKPTQIPQPTKRNNGYWYYCVFAHFPAKSGSIRR